MQRQPACLQRLEVVPASQHHRLGQGLQLLHWSSTWTQAPESMSMAAWWACWLSMGHRCGHHLSCKASTDCLPWIVGGTGAAAYLS